ncbi:DSD1 family PLP-dependent enzyme [Psychromarinibacter halotolerans]|uniref:DSD1 family PLP-dependent enzyme n=1 Tax=Psychromarinibacter halotolerans TaxID=1775175 RepID=A0ABV7GUY6_9RHOB|nr:DSD1 family PLP-dependent enzyme [Psychromarinibacter halotolerans]MDF0596212.1 DSD1 family PLP-dependent enzyme [Psychromarinibacter halotolerans]
MKDLQDLQVGYDIPAEPGMAAADIQTPALVLDLDALERNIRKLGDHARAHGIRHRAHGKMHRSVDVAKLQMELGGAVGVCCQKVAEAETFVRGGVTDVLITNQVVDPVKIDRMMRLPSLGGTVSVCVDDAGNVADLSAAAVRHGVTVDCLVELDCGMRRCGVSTADEALALARAIDDAPGLRFAGIQAYHGTLQHVPTHAERAEIFAALHRLLSGVLDTLKAAGLPAETVTGAGTGSFEFETASGLYTELQCGSYAFMDGDYGRVLDKDGRRLDDGTWENALFVLSQILSTAQPGRAVCDAGLKSTTFECGVPHVFGRTDVTYIQPSDEHGTLEDPANVLKSGEKLKLVPSHCDPTCNLHDWYVGVRNGVVEVLWPVSARGRSY